MRQAGTLGRGSANTPDSPIDNLWRSGMTNSPAVDEDEPIEYAVHPEKFAGATIDPRRLPRIEVETKKSTGPPSDYHNSGLTFSEYNRLKELVQQAPPTIDGQEAVESGLRAPTPLGVSFDAIVSTQVAVPPDPIMAVGPNHLIALVNSRYRVWNKSGTPLTSEITFNTLFSTVSNCQGSFDPFVDYDEAEDRFVIGAETILGNGNSYLCVAATATNDPTGAWNVYSIRGDSLATSTVIDYPHMAIGQDAVYVAANMFNESGGFSHIRLFALAKSALYTGAAVTMAEANLGSAFFTGQPAKLHGFTSGGWPAPGAPHHIVAHNNNGSTRIWRWVNPFVQAPTTYGTVSESFGGAPPNAPELGGGLLNDTNAGRYYDAEYRDGKVWTTRNVLCNLGGGTSESCVDWLAIDVSGGAPVVIEQQTGGAYGSTNDFRYYPDIAVDRNNNIAIGYTKSSASTYTQVWVTGRETSDPPGTLQPEILIRAGLGNYTDGAGCNGTCDRFGDYSGMTVDPDGCTFWFIGEFSDGGIALWKTRIGNFKFDSCSVDSSVGVDKGSYTCDDTLTVTVTDNIRIPAATVAAQTTITARDAAEMTIDSETILAGDWIGSDCVGSDCSIWRATLPVEGTTGSDDDGTLNVVNGGTFVTFYDDPHPAHADQNRVSNVNCQTRFDDGGFLIDGGCELGTGAEQYRDYLDGGEYIAYTYGLFNPPSAPPLTDVRVTLDVTGPAADAGLITVFNPTVEVGGVGQGSLTGVVFNLFIDPAVDSATYRLSEHDFEVSITSPADGYTVAQLLSQTQFVQADDNIVSQSECFNFETDEGFVNTRYVFSYACSGADGCVPSRTVTTVEPPWTRGTGCQSEVRTDVPSMSCDVGGTNANKTNATAGSCGNFAQSSNQLSDGITYTPIFGPANTGNAANGQPWNYQWLFAEWFFDSQMLSGTDVAIATGQFWDNDYVGSTTPATNEIDSLFPFFSGYFVYPNQSWDSATPWDPLDPPANYDGTLFDDSASGLARSDLQWRWAFEGFDADFGTDPTATAATSGLAIDNLNLVYDQYHAEAQTGSCSGAAATISFDQLSYQTCGSGELEVTVLDDNAGATVTVTVTSDDTGDSETLILGGGGPYYTTTLTYDTAGGAGVDDGVLFVTPDDIVRASYDDADPVTTVATGAFVECRGGDVVVDGVAGLADNGDGDSFGDTNEIVNLSLRLRNNSGQELTNVTAVIASDSPNIDCISKDTASFGTLPAGGTGSNDLAGDPFVFKVAPTAQCSNPSFPPTAVFTVFIEADDLDGSSLAQKLTMRLDLNDVGASTVYLEEFDTSPTDFTHQLGPGDDDGNEVSPDGNPCSPYVDEAFWRSTGGNPGGGFFVWTNPAANFPFGAYSDLLDSEIRSATITLPAGATAATLLFDHEYKFDSTDTLLPDGARVDYRVNGGPWQKLTTLPYDGSLIFNSYCNPLCNNFGELECFSENPSSGENIFALLSTGTQTWKRVQGEVTGLAAGDELQFRWRVGSMNLTFFGFPRIGGYGLDNVRVDATQQECDASVWPDEGCGVVFDDASNLVQLCGNGNDVVEPTEIWAVDVDLKNVGSATAVNTTAELAVNPGSPNGVVVTGSPGNFGSIAAEGGIGTASFEFEVDGTAVCVDDIVFDVTNIADSLRSYGDVVAAFAVEVGELLANQSAFQAIDPIVANAGSAESAMSPNLALTLPVAGATLSYDFNYTNIAPTENAFQDNDITGVVNAIGVSTMSPAFTIAAGSAASASVFWELLTYPGGNLDQCTRVFLRTPNGTDVTLKALNDPPSTPYNVLPTYQGANGGPGQYQIGLEERQGGGCNGAANLSSTTMIVTQAPGSASWTANAQVSLSHGGSTTVVKPYGVPDANPYDVGSLYAGPGTYTVIVEENGAGGDARLSSAELFVFDAQCAMGCSGVLPAPPPVADGATGEFMTLDPGVGPGELTIDIDNATCSGDHAVVLYGTIGDYSGYQGAVDLGCDIGDGQSATFTHAGDNVWFNVIWVNANDVAGSPGLASAGQRTWSADGLCNVVAEDTADNTCN
ncbi:MAG TPA: hypothetical protein VD788_15645 [Candidatus Polarisedimenticolaceae bacterium]|nr:hypothetical protein [Candidatus Polarisedimenticolaceae bacterium]